jgi:tetratricopeptide (TPR) repeat protein
MRGLLIWAALALASSSDTAFAAWHEASSDHFVIYADDSERDITQFARQLEQYHAGLQKVTGTAPSVPSPSNRVTVYVVRNEREVRSLADAKGSTVAGFYIPRAGGSMAIVPAVQTRNGSITWSMLVLLHEYAHHFTISSSDGYYPRWLSEGAAEFFASAKFERDGSMWLGRPALHRAYGLAMNSNVQVADVLVPETSSVLKKSGEDAFYGKSWLLYHYLTFEQKRWAQLRSYLDLLATGKSEHDAAVGAFGDLEVLERELDSYVKRSRLPAIQLQADQLKTGPIVVRALSPGAGAVMPALIQSKQGVAAKSAEAQQLVARVRTIAANYPNDAFVLTALAECEYDAGQDERAIAAADAAIKLDPQQTNAYVQKGLALFKEAESAKDRNAAYVAARAPFIALNKIEHDHPLPLIYYYRSFSERGERAPKLAIDGLMRALQVAPFDSNLRMELGLVLLKLGRAPEATITLTPLAYNPHGGRMAAAARGIVERLAKEPNWKGEGLGESSPNGEQDAA